MAPKPLEPIGGEEVFRANFDQLPGAPWVVVRGQWTARDGVLHGSQKGGESVAAMRFPVSLRNGDVEYEVSCPFTASHQLRVQGSRDFPGLLIAFH